VILEAAVLQVREGTEAAFEEAMVKAAPVIAGSLGYIAPRVAAVRRDEGTVSAAGAMGDAGGAHGGFRQSAAFVEWRTLIGPFFDAAPMVEHYEGALRWPRS